MKTEQIYSKDRKRINGIMEIPGFALRAYALFFLKHGTREEFKQNELNWIVSESMRKKIFALLLKAGWIRKQKRDAYICTNPSEIFRKILEFKVTEIIKTAEKEYVFTGLSAVEIWSDYSYIQRGIEKSPYFIKVLKKDLKYWKNFFNKYKIPVYINQGTTIGEYVILIPVNKIKAEEKNGLKVENLKETIKIAKSNEMHNYAYYYIINKYKKENE